MSSVRETALAALAAALAGTGIALVRNDPLAYAGVPAGGLLALHDGDPGEPDYTMSPMTWHYRHRAQLDVVLQGAVREADFDAALVAVGAALAADRTLGGAVDWCEPGGAAVTDIAVEGAAPFLAASVAIVLHYSTTDPLG